MDKSRILEYSIIINAMVGENMLFNKEVAHNTYGWTDTAFYKFIGFIKKINHLKCYKENKNYYLILKEDID